MAARRGGPVPPAMWVVIQDEKDRKFPRSASYPSVIRPTTAEYHGLVAALEYAIEHGHRKR